MLCLRKEERVLPAASVRDRLAERIQQIEEQESRKIRGKEKLDLKDEVLLDMMPQAFTRNSRIYGYLDLAQGWLVVDASSQTKADEFQETLRETLGSLPVRPLSVNHAPADAMTRWISDYQPPEGFEIGHDLDLKDTSEEGGVIRIRKQNLDSREIRAHIDCGMQTSVIALNFSDRFDCLIDEDLGIKRLRFSDAVLDAADDVDTETAAQRFDTDFALMGAELSRFLPKLIEIFGGEPESSF
jgi:recombination associated protein RdgC